ncbi:hypothetical protein QQ054_20680 [Oscillatoria amoena NRMC-F 0135]|nr:hypothetical protein [Oscillatoria laete-virens]MDL5048430.1 hypothetical protein [Oscillatoria amoena NRMC-F 0135]MDL5055659.1 hypothetical protein [Oscillatoria laete-virens NRMC-F 0139]
MLETEEIKGRSNAALEMALEGMRLLIGHKKRRSNLLRLQKWGRKGAGNV